MCVHTSKVECCMPSGGEKVCQPNGELQVDIYTKESYILP